MCVDYFPEEYLGHTRHTPPVPDRDQESREVLQSQCLWSPAFPPSSADTAAFWALAQADRMCRLVLPCPGEREAVTRSLTEAPEGRKGGFVHSVFWLLL